MNAFAQSSYLLRLLAVGIVASSVGCARRAPPSDDFGGPSPGDSAFLGQELWNDGRAEVAFYRLERKTEGEGQEQILVGTYLLKQPFDPVRQSKAEVGGISSFKWAAFFEYVRGSEQSKLAYVVNTAQASLRPLKVSMTSFDWCANQYLETAFLPGGEARFLKRSDDYGNDSASFTPSALSYPFAEVPWLVRALDFTKEPPIAFSVLSFDGKEKSATATLVSREKRTVGDREEEVERIQIRYAAPAPTVWSRAAQTEETVYRATDAARTLVAMEGEGYRLQLIETVRSAYWQEDVYARLTRVDAHP